MHLIRETCIKNQKYQVAACRYIHIKFSFTGRQYRVFCTSVMHVHCSNERDVWGINKAIKQTRVIAPLWRS